jgi:PTH2 family peptidyl-tRNA hydrolase
MWNGLSLMKTNPYMYIFLNQSLGMSTGKAAAQVAHAAVEAYKISSPEMIEAWEKGGHYAKVTLLAEDSEAMSTYERYINDRGFKTALIIDEGRTEIAKLSRTAMGVEIVDKNDEHTALTFGEFQTYKDLKSDREHAYTLVYDEHLNRRGKKVKERCQSG